jgi:hypothetical protein
MGVLAECGPGNKLAKEFRPMNDQYQGGYLDDIVSR